MPDLPPPTLPPPSPPHLLVKYLGPVEVDHRGRPVRLAPRQQELVGFLARRAGELVPYGAIADALWGPQPTVDTGQLLRTLVWQVRKKLAAAPGPDDDGAGPGPTGDDCIVTWAGSYRLNVAWADVDAGRFESLVDEARTAAGAGELARGLAAVDEGLGLWRGPAFGELAERPWAADAASHWDRLRLQALELRAELLLGLGEHARALTVLEPLVREHPLRERFWEQLMLARYRAGLQADALRAYEAVRRELREQLGQPPGRALQRLYAQVLDQDPALDWAPPAAMTLPRRPPSPPPLAAPAGLEAPPTTFVGRAGELAELAVRADEHRLVTVTGPGGCGKTRLALELAARAAARTGRPAHLVDLTTAAGDEGVVPALAAALQLPADADLAAVAGALGEEEELVVLDNAEHVIEGVSVTVEQLLRRCPRVRMLVTSREELRVPTESVWLVPGLSLPGPLATGHGELAASEAVQLFVDRAGLAGPGADLAAVAGICRRLDGMPLAIELAAALVPALSPADIAARLDRHLDLLNRGPRTAAPRQRTIEATIAWSYDLLEPAEQHLLRRLAVFVGDFDLPAAEAVAGDVDAGGDAAVTLAALRAKSLVTRAPDGGGARYRLLETIRQFAQRRLDPAGLDAARRRHGHHYAAFAEEAAGRLAGPDASSWLERVRREFPNLREALQWSITTGDIDTGLRLAGGVRLYLGRLGRVDGVSQWLGHVLDHGDRLTPDQQLRAFNLATAAAFTRGDFTRTCNLGERAIELARRLDQPRQLADALINRAGVAVFDGHEDRARECVAEGLPLCHRLGDRWGEAWLRSFAGVAHRNQHHPDDARAQLQRALAIFRDLGDDHSELLPLVYLALLDEDAGDLDAAAERAHRAAMLARPTGDARYLSMAQCTLGRVEISRGNLAEARRALLASFVDHAHHRHHLITVRAIEGLAFLAARRRRHVDAAVLLGFAHRYRQRWGIDSHAPTDRQHKDHVLAAITTAVGPGEAEHAAETGAGLTLAEAISRATVSTAPD